MGLKAARGVVEEGVFSVRLSVRRETVSLPKDSSGVGEFERRLEEVGEPAVIRDSRDGTVLVRKGKKFRIEDSAHVAAYDGSTYRSRTLRTVGFQVGDRTQVNWIAGETNRVIPPHRSLDPLKACWSLEPWASDPQLWDGVLTYLEKYPSTLRNLPNGKVEVTITVASPGWTVARQWDLPVPPLSWSQGLEYRVVLDPQRDFLIERIDRLGTSLETGREEEPLVRVYEVRRVGKAWMPTRYTLSAPLMEPGKITATQFRVSEIESQVPDEAFRLKFKEGDLQIRAESPKVLGEDVLYRLDGAESWVRQPTRSEREQSKTYQEYGMYVGALALLIVALWAVPHLIRRLRSPK